jgi:hypothetical protein
MRNFLIAAAGLFVLSSQALAAQATCVPFVRADDVSDGYTVDAKGALVLINPSFDRPGDPSDPFVIGAQVIPLNEGADDTLASLPASGTVCLKGTQASRDTFFAYSVSLQH